jgi:hypothetical protein
VAVDMGYRGHRLPDKLPDKLPNKLQINYQINYQINFQINFQNILSSLQDKKIKLIN